ncbi:protein big brother [Galendromus occidentalis]|uniref:Protein big brother n=1 Tax=Galendromus occidentalis TaxID=34638 RepID=A0AAJ6QWH9_9ACAR|nr:protein big brother [Galendromus occidentalis]
MLPFETPTIFDQLPRYIYYIPRVVLNQRHKFETDELFKKCSRDSEVRFTGYRDRPREERNFRFQTGLREGHTELAYVSHGTNLQLVFSPRSNNYGSDYCDFDKEQGKVHIQSSFIMNGVCVRWRGWIDLQKLEGTGCLEFDEEKAKIEDEILKAQIANHRERMRESDSKRFIRDSVEGETNIAYHPA